MAQFILPSNDVLKDKVVVLTGRLEFGEFLHELVGFDTALSVLIVSLFGACIDNYNFKGN